MKVLLLSVALLSSVYFAAATEVVCNSYDVVIPNPDDCGSFYTCDNGVARLTPCPPSLQFNPDASVCDRPENVECEVTTTGKPTPTTGKPTSTSSTSKPTSTTSTTSKPTSSTTTTTTSRPTSTSSTTTTTTSRPTSSTTTSTTSKPTSTSSTTTSTTSRPTSTSSSTSTSTTSTTPTTPTTSRPNSTTTEEPSTTDCPNEGSAILPDPDSCSAFLVCINGNSVSVNCPKDLLYNPEIEQCDVAENVLCGDEITTTTTEMDTTTQKPTTNSSTTSTTSRPTSTSSTTTSTTSRPTSTSSTTSSTTTSTTSRPTSTSSTTTSTTSRPTSTSSTTTSTTSRPTSTSSTTSSTTTSTTSRPTSTSSTTTSTTSRPTSTSSTTSSTTTSTTSRPTSTSSTTTSTTSRPTSTSSSTSTSTTSTTSTTSRPTTTEVPEETTTQVTTTEGSVNEPECPETGYAIISNPDDCSSFFVCVNGLSALIECPTGLDFNLTTAKCEDPEIAQCRQDTTTDVPTTTPDPYTPPCPAEGITELINPRDCSSFYVCIDGLFAKLKCPEDLEFNEVKQTCVPSDQSNCTVLVEDYFSENRDFQCSADGSYPNPDDCESYFVCIGGDPILMECPGGLHFDNEILGCNTPELANCEVGSSTSTTSKPTTSSTTSTQKPTSTTSTTAKPTSTSSTTSTTSKPTSTSSTTSTTTTPPEVEPECPANGTQILPNPADCGSFFVCIEGDYGLVECPPGYGFDTDLGNCGEGVVCNGGGTSTPPETHECPSSGIAKVPNPDDCSSYLFCINGRSTVINCPAGLNFNALTATCDPDVACDGPTSSSSSSSSSSTSSTSNPSSPTTSTTSKPTSPPSQTCEAGDIIPNPASCESFFICDTIGPVEVQCPPGLEFNAEAKVCDQPELANCTVESSLNSFLRFWY